MTVAQAHKRQFGVEIECGWNPDSHHSQDFLVLEVYRHMVEAKFPVVNPNDYGGSRGFTKYTVGRDGSGIEVRTPILAGTRGFDELKRIFAFLNDLGCHVTQRDGLHVHHDAPELIMNPTLTYNLVHSWVRNRDAICEMVTPYRKTHMHAWESRSLGNLEAFAQGKTTYKDLWGYECEIAFGRNELNIASLHEHGTVEFRLHEGTLNIDDAIAWIMFGQRFIDSVLHRARPMRKGNRKELLNRIRLSKTEQAKLDAKRMRTYGFA